MPNKVRHIFSYFDGSPLIALLWELSCVTPQCFLTIYGQNGHINTCVFRLNITYYREFIVV